jgi:hypothetical protein
MICEESNIWKVLTILSFIMLLAMTVASKPIEKIAAALTEKYEAKARAKVCADIRLKQNVFMAYTRTTWMGGCITTTASLNLYLYGDNKKKAQAIIKSMKDKEGEPYVAIEKYCSKAYMKLLEDHNIEEQIVSELYKSQNCIDRSGDKSDE